MTQLLSQLKSALTPQQIHPGITVAGLSIALCSALTANATAAEFADFLFVVDESGSMNTEHRWLGDMIGSLEAGLQAKGVGLGTQSNRYGLVGFGSSTQGKLGRSLLMGNQQFGSANQFSTATNSLITSGKDEDGYAAIDFGFSNYNFRKNAAVNIVLVTDEDRDVLKPSHSFNSILNQLQGYNALLNVVVNASSKDNAGNSLVGMDGHGNGFIADGSGGYTTIVHPTAMLPNVKAFESTVADYTNLAWATGNDTVRGATWDLNLLRAGGLDAQSFTQAFVDIKATEAYRQKPNKETVPEPTSTLLISGLVLGLGKKIKARMR
ncbi:MAG: VWA domain-containing protein [Spirulina sp. SIO3F2]|nr:VWA domain-containing protein [Spirulina sp. SIO3F2]